MKRGRHQDKNGFQCAAVWHRQALVLTESDVGSKLIHFLIQSEPISSSFNPSGRNPTLEYNPPVLQMIRCLRTAGRIPLTG